MREKGKKKYDGFLPALTDRISVAYIVCEKEIVLMVFHGPLVYGLGSRKPSYRE